MMQESARLAIMRHQIAAQIAAERAPRLIERIKIETRWLLLTTSVDDAIDHDSARQSLVASWHTIRNAGAPADDIARHFYDIAAEQAATFARLIIARRKKRGR